MEHYPFPDNEVERIQRLHLYDLHGLGKEPSLDVFAQAACLITDCPSSLIAMMEEETQFIQSCVGLELDSVDRRHTICQYTIMSRNVMVIEDTFNDPRSSSNPLVKAGGIRFYAGVPIMDEEGYALGTICVIDYIPKTLSDKQLDSLKQLGEAVSKLLLSKKRNKQSIYFEEVFDVSNNLMCVLDDSYKIKIVNPSFEELLNVKSSAVIDMSIVKVLGDNNVEDHLKELNENNCTVSFRTHKDILDGSDIIIEWYFKLNPSNKEIFAFGRNITTEIEERTKLENSERRFRNFFENSIGLMSMHDLEGNILSVNEKGRENLKYRKEEITSLNLRDLVVEANVTGVDDYLKRIEENKEDTGMMVIRAKDGEINYWLYNNILDVDSDGVAYVVSTALNMTERIKLERELRRAQKTLEQSNLVAQVGAWEIDLDTNIVTWSDSAKVIHGVDKDFKPDFTRSINFYDLESQERLIAAYTRAVEEGVSYDLQLRILTAQNQLIWVRVKGIPEFENNRCKRVYGIIQDIDRSKKVYLELENKQAMLRAFVSNVPASVAMFDRDFNCVSVSNQWIQDFHKNEQSVVGQNLHTLFPEIPPERKRIYIEALQGKIYKNRDEVIFKNESEEPQHYDWEVRPWYLSDNTIGGIIIQIQNITDTVKANEELRTAKRLADIANRTKSEFLANMSHEIRTPLNGVIGFSDLLMKTPLSEVQLQYLHYINESGNTLLNIINDILDFSKIESGKLELYVDKYDVYEMVNQVINVVLYQAQRKGIELLLNIELGLPNFIWIDEVRVKQILVNLLGNAVKFTEGGEIELKVEKKRIDKDKIVLRFSVRDTGIGIPIDKQQRMFEAFTQEDSSVSKKYGGTGLGLTISNNLLRYMGSKLFLESELNKGSTFFFDLELDCEYSTLQDDAELEQIKRVLVVDDNSANRTIMEHMLSFKGIECVLASSGLEALQMLMRGDRFDTILMDYHMPILSGLETIDKIKELFNNQGELVPLIVLHTSSEEHEVINTFRQEERSFCLMKPIKSNELYDMMKRVVLQNKEDQLKVDLNTAIKVGDSIYDQNLKVLLADDNPVNMALNMHIMTGLMPKATLVQVENGLEAVEACMKDSFDLILMDVQMPVMDGVEATKNIRKLAGYADTPIIGVTAGNVVGEREKCLINGMSGFLAKPIRQKDLEETIGLHMKGGEDVQTINSEDYLNLDALNEQVGGDDSFREYFLELVLSEINQTAAILNEEANIMNSSGMKASLHKLRGTAATSGLFKLTESCLNLERELIERDLSVDEVRNHMTSINTDIGIGINLIKQIKK